jgi:uncharacterized membrane protein YeaQ/YmgE (transglycosylase-associated protein family)
MDTSLFVFGILLAGLVLGSTARFLLPGDQRLTLAETTLIGIAGAGVGSVLVNIFDRGTSMTAPGIASALGALVGSLIVLGVSTFIASKLGLRSDPTVSVAELLEQGETSTVEFKSTARWNLHTQARDDRVELVIAKTVAGFLNGEGGTLLIGVDDGGNAIGLDTDLRLMKQPDNDRYQLWLTDYLEGALGKPSLAYITIRFESVGTTDVAVIEVQPSERPVYLDEPKGQRTADFYVRMGNSTRKLLTDEFATYRQSRWK